MLGATTEIIPLRLQTELLRDIEVRKANALPIPRQHRAIRQQENVQNDAKSDTWVNRNIADPLPWVTSSTVRIKLRMRVLLIVTHGMKALGMP